MGFSKAEVSEIVRRVLMKTLQQSASTAPEAAPAPPTAVHARRILGESDVQAAPAGADLEISPGTLVTPLARQMAMERGVRLVERVATPTPGSPAPAATMTASKAGERRVALGADHGGFPLK